TENLPSAPQPQRTQNSPGTPPTNLATPVVAAVLQSGSPPPSSSSAGTQAPQRSSRPGQTVRLTRVQAEQLALKNNPQISVGRLLALAQHQIYRESRAALLPNFNGSITAVDANEGSRIGAGSLTASRLLEHAGAGVTLSQLLTDFGRTTNLVSSAK